MREFFIKLKNASEAGCIYSSATGLDCVLCLNTASTSSLEGTNRTAGITAPTHHHTAPRQRHPTPLLLGHRRIKGASSAQLEKLASHTTGFGSLSARILRRCKESAPVTCFQALRVWMPSHAGRGPGGGGRSIDNCLERGQPAGQGRVGSAAWRVVAGESMPLA